MIKELKFRFKHTALYDKWEKIYHQIDVEDVFLDSFPKSGNTWIRFMITGLYLWEINQGRSEPNYFNIHTYVKDSQLERIKPRKYFSGLPRMIKSHRDFTPLYPRVVLVVRDVRDVMISYFNFLNRNEVIYNSFDEFIKSKIHGVEAWVRHTESWMSSKTYANKKVLFLRYEDMIDDPKAGLKEIFKFINVTFPDEAFEFAIANSSKEKIKFLESTYGRARTSKVPFLRKGEKQQWKQEMLPEHLQYINEVAGTTLIKCGYQL